MYGSGNSLYHKLKSIGFNKIDSFSRNLPFVYFFRKGRPAFEGIEEIGPTDTVQIQKAIALNSIIPDGTIESPLFGPARTWQALHWKGTSADIILSDTTAVEVWGVKSNGSSSLMATVNPARDTSLSFIDTKTYPFLRLRLQNKDNLNLTPQQLNYWRLNATLAPEGSVAPNILFQMSADTVEQGEPIMFGLAFKNISNVPFDLSLIHI